MGSLWDKTPRTLRNIEKYNLSALCDLCGEYKTLEN